SFNHTTPTEISTLSLHDALPILRSVVVLPQPEGPSRQRNSPSSTVKLAALTAWKSPKDLSSASTLICAIPPYSLTFETTMNITVDRKSTRLNSSHLVISYAVFCL